MALQGGVRISKDLRVIMKQLNLESLLRSVTPYTSTRSRPISPVHLPRVGAG